MAEALVAHASVRIEASAAKVWNALVDPETMKRYMPLRDVISDWREGSSIIWKSDFQEKPFEVRGTILRFEPERLLEYDHSLPIFRSSGSLNTPATHLRVTIELRDEGGQTHVSVIEQGNRNRREFEHSEGSWRMVLHGMKALLEGTLVQEGTA